jgi:hypothetical protein
MGPVFCPHCRRDLWWPGEQSRKSLECPFCGGHIHMPLGTVAPPFKLIVLLVVGLVVVLAVVVWWLLSR